MEAQIDQSSEIFKDPPVPQIVMGDLSSDNTAQVGSAQSPIASTMKSRNFKSGVSGWMLSSNGETEGIPGPRFILFKVMGPLSSHSVSTSVGGDLEMPLAGTITEIGAYVDTAGVTGTATIDVNKNGTTIMSATKISIETAEKSSRNAATQPVLTTTTFAKGDIITVDIDAIQTTPAKGLTLRLGIR